MDAYRVVDYLVQGCSELGVRHIFGVDGANIEDLYDAIFEFSSGTAPPKPSMVGVVAKHEFSAATMADGYARSTGGVGVVAATSGGGAMNLVSGLAESFTSRVPVLALVGQPPTSSAGKGAFQDTSGLAGTIDAERLFAEVSRYCARVERPKDLPEHFARAVSAARTGGSAVLLLPKDVQQAPVGAAFDYRPHPPRYISDTDGISRVVAALAAARRVGKVVVIAGDQVGRDDARAELHNLVRVLDAAVGVTPDGRDAYGSREPGYCGVAGVMGHPELVEAVAESKLCLLIGTRLPMTASMPPITDVELASIGAEPPYLDSMHAESRNLADTLAEIAVALGGSGHDAEPLRRPAPQRLQPPQATGPGLRYRETVEAISATLTDGCDVFADAGNTGASVVHHLDVPPGGRFTVALGMGGMGYGFGAAIGSAFARARRTVLIAGDGAFYMHGMEIHTAVEYALPITFIVFNNNAHGMCLTREQLFYRNRYSFNRFQPASLGEGVAAMFPSLPSFAVRTFDELIEALSRSSESEGPHFISVDCDPDEIPPFVPFLPSDH